MAILLNGNIIKIILFFNKHKLNVKNSFFKFPPL